MEVLHRTSKWGEVRRLACPLRRFPFAAPPNCGGKVVAPATKGGHTRMVHEVYDALFFSPYLSFPLEGKSREAGKGVRGRVPIGCSIAILTANRRPPSPYGPLPLQACGTRFNKCGCKVFFIKRRLLSIHRRPTTTLAPKGETTHYDLCVALLLQIMFAVHAKGASNLSPLRTFGPSGRQPSSPTGLVHLNLHAPISKAAFFLTTSLTCIRHAGIM